MTLRTHQVALSALIPLLGYKFFGQAPKTAANKCENQIGGIMLNGQKSAGQLEATNRVMRQHPIEWILVATCPSKY